MSSSEHGFKLKKTVVMGRFLPPIKLGAEQLPLTVGTMTGSWGLEEQNERNTNKGQVGTIIILKNEGFAMNWRMTTNDLPRQYLSSGTMMKS